MTKTNHSTPESAKENTGADPTISLLREFTALERQRHRLFDEMLGDATCDQMVDVLHARQQEICTTLATMRPGTPAAIAAALRAADLWQPDLAVQPDDDAGSPAERVLGWAIKHAGVLEEAPKADAGGGAIASVLNDLSDARGSLRDIMHGIYGLRDLLRKSGGGGCDGRRGAALWAAGELEGCAENAISLVESAIVALGGKLHADAEDV